MARKRILKIILLVTLASNANTSATMSIKNMFKVGTYATLGLLGYSKVVKPVSKFIFGQRSHSIFNKIDTGITISLVGTFISGVLYLYNKFAPKRKIRKTKTTTPIAKKKTVVHSHETKPEVQAPEKEEQDNCTICLEEMEENDDQIKELECKHKFHADCIGEWTSRNNTCPVCRHQVAETAEERTAREQQARREREYQERIEREQLMEQLAEQEIAYDYYNREVYREDEDFVALAWLAYIRALTYAPDDY